MARDEAPAGRAWCCSAVRTYTVSRRRWETHPSSLYGPATRRRTASRGSAAQGCPGCGEDVLPGIGATVADPDAACRDTYLRGDFQQPRRDRFVLCSRPLRARQPQPPQRIQQHVSERGKVQPQLIGPQSLRAQPVAEQTQLLLDAVFHLASGAVELLIELLRGPGLWAERRDQVARILLALDLFRFGHHAPRSRPALLGAISELTEHPRGFSGTPVLLLGFLHGPADDAPQPLVSREAEHVVQRLFFAPGHQLLAAEARVRPQEDAHLRPARANLPHHALHFFQASRTGILIRRPQPRTQQMIPAEHVQRQIAVVPVVAVEKTTFLLPMQRRVGGVQVQQDLARRPRVRLQEEVYQQGIDRFRRVKDLVVAFPAGRTAGRAFQPVQGTLARQRRAQVAV